MGASIGKVRAPIGEGRVRAAARRASSSIPASRVAGRGDRGRTRAAACATTSPLGNATKRREGIVCVGEGGGGAWTRQGLVARGRGVSGTTGISIPGERGRSRRAQGRTRGPARSRREISRESSSARVRASANMSSARAGCAGQRASDREPDRVPLGVFFLLSVLLWVHLLDSESSRSVGSAVDQGARDPPPPADLTRKPKLRAAGRATPPRAATRAR